MEPKEIHIIDCGLVDYDQAFKQQLEMLADRQADRIANTVLLVEHPPVITLGARKTENKLIASAAELDEKGIALVKVGRGGGTTAHNPGQIVAYPIIKLKSLNLGVNEYVRRLEEIGIQLLAKLGVQAQRRKGYPGLWVDHRKIASVGVQIKKWTTIHGIAINIQNDLRIFDNIVPCGLTDVEMTSVHKETSKHWPMDEVKMLLKEICIEQLGS